MRNNFTKATQRAAYERSGGICECHLIPHVFRNPCGRPLEDSRIRYEHIDPDAISHRNDIDNAAALRIECWRFKTDKYDLPKIAKSNRVRDNARCVRDPHRRRMPGGRDSNTKIKMDGTVVDRRTGARL